MPVHPALQFIATAFKDALQDPAHVVSQLAPKCYECKGKTILSCSQCGEACCPRHIYINPMTMDSVCDHCVNGD